MKQIRIAITVTLLGLCRSWLPGQSLSGHISSEHTGEDLPYASVYLHEVMRGTLADTAGNYRMDQLHPGKYTVEFSYVGHGSEVKEISLAEGQNLVLDIELHEEVVEGHDVVISSPYPGTQDENPVQVVQVDGKDIESQGQPNLMTALANVPGVHQVGTGIGIGKPVIRGLSFNRVVVYSQGVRLENQQWGDEHGLGLMGMGIEKVEIIKSPSSLLYGSDAMGGVLHVIDERPAQVGKTVGDAGLQLYSNTRGFSGDAGIKGSGKVFRYGIRAGGSSHADYQQGDGEKVYYSRFRNTGLKAFAGISLPSVTSTLRANYIDSKVGIPDHVSISGDAGRDYSGGPHQELRTLLFSNQSVFFLGKHKAKLNLGYTFNDRVEFHFHDVDSTGNFFEGETPQKGLDMTASSATFDGKWYFPAAGRFEFLLGTQGMYQLNRNFGAEALVPDSRVFDIGLMSMVRARWERIEMQLGLRGDRRSILADDLGRPIQANYRPGFERSFGSFNGAVGGVFHLKETLLLRVNLASGFRAPNLAELASNGSHAGTNRFEIGDPDLRSEQNIQLDLGLHLHSEHVSFDISLYDNFILRYIYATPIDSLIDGDPVYQYIQGDANLYGGEAFIDIHPHPLHWLHLESGIALVIGQTMDGEYLPQIPALRWNHNFKAEFEGPGGLGESFFKLGFSHLFAQNLVTAPETSTPSYFLVNASAGTGIQIGDQQITLGLSGQNLLNKRYADHLSRLKPDGILNIGRNITFLIRVPFQIHTSK